MHRNTGLLKAIVRPSMAGAGSEWWAIFTFLFTLSCFRRSVNHFFKIFSVTCLRARLFITVLDG
jgi:hypothetical protein